MTGTLFGEVSGDASVEKGDCLRRMDRSSTGLELQGGVALRGRDFSRREKGGELFGERLRSEGGGEEEVIRSITSLSKVESMSSTGLNDSSSFPTSTNWSSWLASSSFSPSSSSTPSLTCRFSVASFDFSVSDWCSSLASSVAEDSNWLCSWAAMIVLSGSSFSPVSSTGPSG